jgi:hypothetical protein
MEFYMEPKFTKGPWRVGHGACHDIYAPKRNGHQQKIAVCPTQSGQRDYDSVECAGNARLIEAAPAMRLALDAIACGIGRLDGVEFCALGIRYALYPFLEFDADFFQALEAEVAKARSKTLPDAA